MLNIDVGLHCTLHEVNTTKECHGFVFGSEIYEDFVILGQQTLESLILSELVLSLLGRGSVEDVGLKKITQIKLC